MPNHRLIRRIFVAVAALFVANFAYTRYAAAHFLPVQAMAKAVAQGDGCVVVLGDSRMAYRIDEPTFLATLRARGVTSACLADLTLGGVDVVGQSILLREYLARGRKPKLVVVGYSGASLLRGFDPLGPVASSEVAAFDSLRGSEALVLLWSHPSDVTLLYPGFPFAHFDSGARFLITRASMLGALGSSLWARTQQFQRSLIGKAPQKDETVPGAAHRDVAQQSAEPGAQNFAEIRDARRRGAGPVHPVFAAMQEWLASRHVPLVLTQVPVKEAVRTHLLQSAEFGEYRATLERDSRQSLVDLSKVTGIDDAKYIDGLHLDTDGSRRFCAAFAETLVSRLVD